MIFSAKNEAGVPLWKLVLSGKKTVTRRPKGHSYKVDRDYAMQPKRGKTAKCRIRIIRVEDDQEWCARNLPREARREAKREGFKTWEGVWARIASIYEEVPPLDRIEFEKLTTTGG